MIAFGCLINEPERYLRHAGPGIRRAAEPDSVVYPQGAPHSPVPIYNWILDQAAKHENLEALVLVDEETEILDGALCAKVREAMRDPQPAVIGCAGARRVRGMAWWEGEEVFVSCVYRCADLGGELLAPLLSDGWSSEPRPRDQLPAQVDTVDGHLMALSPWAVRNLRFDESLGPRHGFVYDLCMQARRAGRKLLVADLAVAHTRPLGVVKDPEAWIEAHMRVAEKWDPDAAAAPEQWRPRARRAEGEASAARLLSASKMYEIQALVRTQERELAAATGTISWRVTAPLRRLGMLARSRRSRP